jgi:hypothetical protein
MSHRSPPYDPFQSSISFCQAERRRLWCIHDFICKYTFGLFSHQQCFTSHSYTQHVVLRCVSMMRAFIKRWNRDSKPWINRWQNQMNPHDRFVPCHEWVQRETFWGRQKETEEWTPLHWTRSLSHRTHGMFGNRCAYFLSTNSRRRRHGSPLPKRKSCGNHGLSPSSLRRQKIRQKVRTARCALPCSVFQRYHSIIHRVCVCIDFCHSLVTFQLAFCSWIHLYFCCVCFFMRSRSRKKTKYTTASVTRAIVFYYSSGEW